MANPTRRDQVFISYSHKDKKLVEQLQTSLKPLVRDKKISVWDDTKIKSGDAWREQIKAAIESAKVAVLLVSPDYLASDFIAEHELPPLLEAAQKEGLRILWIAARFSMYEETEIARYQAVNDPARPLASISGANREREIVRICKEIKAAVLEHATDAVKTSNQATVERVSDIVKSAEAAKSPGRLTIDVLPTATERGQEPKILVRITDPEGDYRTRWSVTLRSPSGATQTKDATWPGAGRVFRARFPTSESRSGKWSGMAIRNGTEHHDFSAALPAPDSGLQDTRESEAGREGDAAKPAGSITEANGGVLTIDPAPLLHGGGRTWNEPAHESQSVKSLLDALWSRLRPYLPAHAYGEAWVLRNKETKEVYWSLTVDLETYHGLGREALTLKEAGIAPGMTLEVVPLSSSKDKTG